MLIKCDKINQKKIILIDRDFDGSFLMLKILQSQILFATKFLLISSY